LAALFINSLSVLDDIYLIEKEIIFKMPPKRKYTVELELKSIKKATPNFVEEDFRR